MICPKCNTPNDDNSSFCVQCGEALPQPQSQPQPQPQPQTPPKKKKMGTGAKVAIALGSVGLVGVIGAVIVVVLIIAMVIAIPLILKTTKKKDNISIQSSQQVQGEIKDELDDYLPKEEDTEEKEDIIIDIQPPAQEEPAPEESPAVSSPYKLMNVTSNLGLNMRARPDTSSPVVAVLLQDHHVFVERTENNWAYVNCGELKGWCSLDYLQPVPFQGTKTYCESEIEAARAAADLIIDSYYDRTTGGRTDITAANAYAYFESCCDVYSYATSFGSQFEKLIPVAADEYYAYYFVEDSKIKTVEDLCNKYFSCFSDELAASCLRGKVLLLDGRLAVAFRSDCYYGYYVSHSYTVNQVAPDRIEVNVVVQEYDSSLKRDSSGKATPDSPIYETYYTFPCVIEDGVWVFESMDVVFDR